MADEPKQNFYEGDTVVLKSGGPKMTVQKVFPDGFTLMCLWFTDAKELKQGNFGYAMVEKVVAGERKAS